MGPFVPDVISPELNLIVAFFVGIAFGFVLEQAGFSSSRKLTGLFYGTDFTVLRVFFTAGVTAMSGVLLFGYFGLLDLRVIYINPTFLHSAMIGGGVMGVGFVVGGYCPGTSFCGAAIGKLDAMAFVAGGVLGAFIFGESFPLLRELYTAGSLGDLTVGDALGLPPGWFALGLILVAMSAFVVTTMLERRNNPSAPAHGFNPRPHRLAAAGLLGLGIVLAALPDRESSLLAKASNAEYRREHPVVMMSADELAFRIIDGDPLLRIVDARTPEEYAEFSLPKAVNIPVADMFGKEWRDILSEIRRQKIVIADTEADAVAAASLLRVLGYEEIVALEGGLTAFSDTVLNAALPQRPLNAAEQDIYRFRLRAAPQLAALIQERRVPARTERRVRTIQGGCGM